MLKSIWRTCCSLKIAIILASIATLLAMGGSLVMHFNPDVFGNLDNTTLIQWTEESGGTNPGLSWWLYATGFLIVLLTLNTACCFLDWLFVIRARWRKTGEYLIHVGFVLVVVAYFWGSLAGARSSGIRIAEGEIRPLEVMPGHYLRLDKFEPVLNDQGRPIDMLNTVTLLEGDEVVASQTVKTNTPLLHEGLVIVPSSFSRLTTGFEILVPSMGKGYRLTAGDAVPLKDGYRLIADAFVPDAVESGGRVFRRSDELREPAYLLRLQKDGKEQWRGWYFLGGPMPGKLRQAGFQLIVRSPVYKPVSYLTANRDPGAGLALAGGISITFGVFLALFSFYYKRARGDRPDIG